MDVSPQQMMAELHAQLLSQYQALPPLNIDLTRGKPCAEQLDLSDALDGLLAGDYMDDGADTRNYGGIDGLAKAKHIGAWLLDAPSDHVLVGGNSSLTLMAQCMHIGAQFGFQGTPWPKGSKFICPAPGYDRHFSLCELYGIEMLPVAMTDSGPDMDAVEKIVASEENVVGIWCVPKYANPTGVTYSQETVTRLVKAAKQAGPQFRIFWDNAYSVHDLGEPSSLPSLWQAAITEQAEDSILMFASTSKITHAGSGLAFMAASDNILARVKHFLSHITIGPDKVNQLRHIHLFGSEEKLKAHMTAHAQILAPKFAKVVEVLEKLLAGKGVAKWSSATGGYFISIDTAPGLASRTVTLAGQAGVKFTPAGATFPYGKDPLDCNIRIAPSMASVAEVEQAMQVFCLCLKIAALEQSLSKV